jgi:hypothetical protein
MAHYIVKETVVLIRYVEADTKEAAIASVKEMSVREFDEVDCSIESKFAAEEYEN